MTRANSMSAKVSRYLTFRRGLGYRLKFEGRLLEQFGEFADTAHHRGPLTVELALRWAQSSKDCARLYCARRLEVVRCFARYLAVTEAGTEVPGRRLLGPAHRRTTPHIYTVMELSALMAAARRLSPADGVRPHTYATLFGLLPCSGLRISEALRLVQDDVDFGQGLLIVRETKFRKTRLVPLHPTAVTALQTYAETRSRILKASRSDRFFLSDQGLGLPYSTVNGVFRRLCESLEITGAPRQHPRLHDLRHTFACRRIEEWYVGGANLDHAISALSVYLGHAKVTDTYWYLTATPDLMAVAAKRFESFASAETEEANA
ncbi:MAG: tyrosine-type recombinase/integrase [Patescibacteria group bacterium]|nr:tyrosine-type recombinase/integrase [Patescibacteria group bacterium]